MRAFLLLLAVFGLVSCSIDIEGAAKSQDQCNRSEWSAGILEGQDLFSMHEPTQFKNPVLTAQAVTDFRAGFIADTFMIPHRGTWYLFFEVLHADTEKGDIGYATSSDRVHWSYRGVVLHENFHLSYPYVFNDRGSFYMIPESRQSQSIRLYKADPFPSSWKLEKVLIEGNYADPSIVYWDHRWWIFAVEDSYSLAIFYADQLEGPWKKHPMSPLYEYDKTKTRPGGRMIPYEGKLVRFAQDGIGGYGHQLRAFIIDKLTPEEFREHEAPSSPILHPEGNGWKARAMHTMDPWRLPNGTWTAVVDGAGCPD